MFLRGVNPNKRWELKAGKSRILLTYFEHIKEHFVEHLIIKDPYCAHHKDKLQSFLKEMVGIAQKIKNITIICCGQNPRNETFMDRNQLKKSLDSLKDIFHPNIKIESVVKPYFKKVAFHDRSLEFKVIDAQALSYIHVYDLTAGIDYLMDPSKEMKLFYYVKTN